MYTNSPSIGKVEKDQTAFQLYDSIESLLADSVVGSHRHTHAIIKYRMVSKGLREAVDNAVERWCNTFSQIQARLVRSRISSNCTELRFQTLVTLEKLIKEAFGSCEATFRSVIHLSKMDEVIYFAVANKRCVLCGGDMQCETKLPIVEDAECPKLCPLYTFAHRVCTRKHVVTITESLPHFVRVKNNHQEENERELVALSHMASNENIHIPKQAFTVKYLLPKMSDWYRIASHSVHCNSTATNARHGMVVWLRPHKRVKPEDTLYGALGIRPDLVTEALNYYADHLVQLRALTLARRLSVKKRTEELTGAYEADVRLWLGKGKTRWRSIEELQCVHECIMSSSAIDRLIDPSVKRKDKLTVASVCNSLHVFSRTIDNMRGGMASSTMDWVVRCAKVYEIFGELAWQMQYIDSEMVDLAVENEAKSHAEVFTLMQNLNSDSIIKVGSIVQSLHQHAPHLPGHLDRFVFKVKILISEESHLSSLFSMTYSEIGKLKYAVSSELQYGATLPKIPVASDETDDSLGLQLADFLCTIFKVCLGERAGMARALALEIMFSLDTFQELLRDCEAVRTCKEEQQSYATLC